MSYSRNALSRPSLVLRGRLLAAVCLLLASPIPGAAEEAGVADADRVWEDRALVMEERLARPERTEEALAAYLAQLTDTADSEPGGLAREIEARWKALRAAHYLSEFTSASEARRDEAVDQATRLAESSLKALARDAGRDRFADLEDSELRRDLAEQELDAGDVAQLHFWSAIVWGAQGQRVGFLTIVREGIARRMYDDTSLALRLDPTIERGGGYRLLSRLHAELPRVPFISMWVDRDQTLPLAERAYAVDPDDPGNQLILALALMEGAPERADEARTLVAGVAQLEPRPGLRAEDLAIREQARKWAAQWAAAED